MLIAVLVCVLGIVLEHYKWPHDSSILHTRFIESDRPVEKLGLLIGLVLNHTVVRWLLAFAASGIVIVLVLSIPACQDSIKRALESGALSPNKLDALLGLAISILMTILSMAARRIAA
jgi:hypothetical protein